MSNLLTVSRLWVLALPVLWLTACGGGAPQEAPQEASQEMSQADASPNRIIGTWDADVMAMMKASMPEGAEVPPEAEEMLKDAFMTVEFNADGTNVMAANMEGEEKEETGSWELVSQDGDTYQLRLTSDTAAGDEKTQNATMVFTDDDNMRITLEGEEGPPMILRRRS